MIYLKLFLTFFKIGAFTFGGGYAMLPLIQAEVAANGWMSQQALVDFIAVSESTPGPFAINIATYVGAQTAGAAGPGWGLLGSLCATLGVVMPSFLIILIVARCYEAFRQNRWVQGALSGLRPAAIGLIATAVLTTAKTAFFEGTFSWSALAAQLSTLAFWAAAVIFAVSLFMALKKVHPIRIILFSAVLGIAVGYGQQLLGIG